MSHKSYDIYHLTDFQIYDLPLVYQNTRRETIEKILFKAWEGGAKGITIYRNNSREVEVLSPKELKKHKCPQCGKDLITEGRCQKCSDEACGYSLCNI